MRGQQVYGHHLAVIGVGLEQLGLGVVDLASDVEDAGSGREVEAPPQNLDLSLARPIGERVEKCVVEPAQGSTSRSPPRATAGGSAEPALILIEVSPS